MRRASSGFTLVELLVVITIIGMLAALPLPAVQSSRESGRRTQCANNQKQLSVSLLQYESANRSFPGWKNRLKTERPYEVSTGPGTKDKFDFVDVSWMVLILPHVERNDLYRAWQDPADGRVMLGFLREACCPSDPPAQTGAGAVPLTYVVNAGNDFGTQIREFGVFSDGSHQMGTAYLTGHDGTTNTLMLSENVCAPGAIRVWATPIPPNCAPGVDSVGFLWSVGLVPDSQYKINQEIDGHQPRPSSRHPGGVVATFCDGHHQFLREDIDYLTYQHLMTPDGQGAGRFLHNQPNHWVCESLKDQFKRGKPPMYEPGPGAAANLHNSTLDISRVQ